MQTAIKPIAILFIMFLGISAFAQQAGGTTTPTGTEIREKVATNIANAFAKKDYAAVRKDFAKIMLDALSEEKIKNTWEGFITKVGEFQKVLTTTEVKEKDYNIIKKRCQFASENATIQVTFNEENQVIGLYLKL